MAMGCSAAMAKPSNLMRILQIAEGQRGTPADRRQASVDTASKAAILVGPSSRKPYWSCAAADDLADAGGVCPAPAGFDEVSHLRNHAIGRDPRGRRRVASAGRYE